MTEHQSEGRDCRLFSGYKPCAPGKVCETCTDPQPFGTRVLVIALDALGAVIQSTALLGAIHREWGPVTVTWVTLPGCVPVFANNPLVWKVMPYTFETTAILPHLTFDIALNIDKTARSAALIESVQATRKLGFGLSATGQIVPWNEEADYFYRLGLDDELKFRTNTKYGTQIMSEALGLTWARDPYQLCLADEEKELIRVYRASIGATDKMVIGYNTGCSPLFANKKMSIAQHLEMIERVQAEFPEAVQVLLGGPDETERNREIARRANGHVVETPTTEGLRRGICYVGACDIVVTGDTSAMHMAIGLECFVVAWFGLSCAAEIDLYDRGVKVECPLPCSPCWKRTCDDLRCVHELDLDAMVDGVRKGMAEGLKNKRVGAKRAS